jgi:TonB family protein
MALNMPNLTSSVGSSWIIRFAEINSKPGAKGEGVSAPVPLRKVDPAYPAALMRERVEGTVILYAVIRSDGTVGDVKVLQGVDDRLDENARDALQKWHFRPGTKNGAPVDLEAVIRIPFRVPRREF